MCDGFGPDVAVSDDQRVNQKSIQEKYERERYEEGALMVWEVLFDPEKRPDDFKKIKALLVMRDAKE